jgi:mRNA-degrading endonuclease toxin of MazEF toxin-antitoxin module
LTVSPGEIWLTDRGDETRRLVFVISDGRFHRSGERAVVAPVLDEVPAVPRPWHIELSRGRTVAVNQLGTMPLDRLLERTELADFETLRQARRAVRSITG